MIDKLIERITEKKSPICVGLDTKFDYLPAEFLSDAYAADPLTYAAENIFQFNRILIDEIADIVPAVKVQAAYYEMYGCEGVKAFRDTIAYAKDAGLVVIADVKRNDIGATATAYSGAYLGRAKIGDREVPVFDADFATVNGYLGTDGIAPFAADCEQYNKGIFVLVKTSNQSSGELQDKMIDGKPVYEYMADMVDEWGKDLVGKYGYSEVGAVIGATYPEQAQAIREKHPSIFVLIPGYGAQGGQASGLIPNFDKKGLGGIVNNSRAILTAYRNEKYKGMDFAKAARQATLDMQEDILNTFAKNGIGY
ncbi:orotidine 5'-phosphate decarboxylase [Christensenellaceae bacterium]|nr:orotidine 5'-phosphate decarboxylase [Christensenellaceae bacterium]BDF60821.1 orotidine 5'-phosphate decarboxylase [Christensenellaceae bacterium]